MVNVHSANNTMTVNVVPSSNVNSVSASNDRSKYYSDLAQHYAELAEGYADNADTSADNALESATSADASADICTGVLENSHFQTVYTDLESENSNIEAVGSNIEDVTSVAGALTDIGNVADELTDIGTVADDLTNIDSVANNISNINAVADNETNINAVNLNATNINAVASDLTNINAVANDLTNIDNASANAILSKQYAIGEPTEPEEGSAKYWASKAAAGQIQADWTQTDDTQKDYIKNKPNLATVATSGSYNDLTNKPTIPDAQVQSDWSQSDNTQVDFIKNKPTIPTVPTELSAFTDDLGTSPVHTHSQYLTSHQDISGKEDVAQAMNTLSTSGTITLTDNSVNKITPTGNITFTLPTVTDLTVFHQILVQLNLSTVYTINVGTTYFFNETSPDLSATGVYDLIFEYDNANAYWVCGLLTKGVAS